MTKERAFAVASQWGSFQRIGDPGACMYAFYAGDGRPVTEAHRLDCLTYLRRRRPDTDRDARQLQRLIRFLANTPLRGEG